MKLGNSYFTGLFKVLGPAGGSIHGGEYQWPLPENGEPGAWTPFVQPLLCEAGYHLTNLPHKWHRKDARLFVVEGQVAASAINGSKGKLSVGSARLLEEVTAGWPFLAMCPSAVVFLVMNGAKLADLPDGCHNLYGANLDGANLDGANLRGANLYGANLRGAHHIQVTVDAITAAGWVVSELGIVTKKTNV